MKYQYSTSHDLEYSHTAESVWGSDDADYVAQDCAENYHNQHDGWESSWPVEMTIWREDGTLLGRFSVELEHEPSFSAREVRP